MNRTSVTQTSKVENVYPHSTGILQRKCASCSNKTTAEVDCQDCINKNSNLQRKLSIGASNDPLEHEAERVSEQVLRMSPNSSIARTVPKIQRASTRFHDLGTSVPDSVNATLSSSGTPMKPNLRQNMEQRFAQDFSHVRVHTGSAAAKSSRDINARAYTSGNNVVFGAGQYSPETRQGQRLLAHELTHVVQQSGTQSSSVQLDRLPCESRTKIDLFAVNLPGSSRTIHDDLPTINSVLCQCGIEMNLTGAVSVNTTLMDLDAPIGVLNTGATATRELNQLVNIRPGGDVIHAYYVPSLSSGALAEGIASTRFTPALPDSILIADGAGAIPIVPAHELGHVLLNDGSHHSNNDNLMADGSTNSGAGELEQSQCSRMP